MICPPLVDRGSQGPRTCDAVLVSRRRLDERRQRAEFIFAEVLRVVRWFECLDESGRLRPIGFGVTTSEPGLLQRAVKDAGVIPAVTEQPRECLDDV